MCDPITIAAIGLTAAGVGANTYAQYQVDQARAAQMEMERVRQAQFDREATALAAKSEDNFDDFAGQQEEATNALASIFQEAANTAPTVAMLPVSASNVTNVQSAADTGAAKAQVNQQGQALAAMRGFGDTLGNIEFENAANARGIGQIADFASGSSDVLPYELEAANGAGKVWGTIGDLATGLGSVATGAALAGGTFAGMGTKLAVAPWESVATGAKLASPVSKAALPLSYALY